MTDRFPPNETPMMPISRRKHKRIEAHSDDELDAAIARAVEKIGEDFWIILHGVDAYMTRRKRRDDRRIAAEAARIYDEVFSDPWGNS